ARRIGRNPAHSGGGDAGEREAAGWGEEGGGEWPGEESEADGAVFAILQERFDAQVIMLRITKEQCGDLQDCLATFEAALNTTSSALDAKGLEIEQMTGEMEKLAG
ncbi:hypothetical protein C0991_005258, partial [Blastosporella zonata]